MSGDFHLNIVYLFFVGALRQAQRPTQGAVLRPCQGFLRVKAVLFVGLGHEVYHSVFVGFHAITFLYSDSRYFDKLSDRKVSTGSVTGLFTFTGDAFEEICHRASLDGF